MSSTDDALSLAEQAEAEAAEAEAQAVAARERATALRTSLAAEQDIADDTDAALDDADAPLDDAPEPDDLESAEDADESVAGRRLPWVTVALSALAGLLVCGLVAASVILLVLHHQTTQRQNRAAAFAAAARQGVINLMSLDFNNGDADIKRLLDSTTGQFRADFEKSKNDFLTVMKDSKVVTRADVKATAVQSMTDDSAVVLVAAASEVSNSAANKQPPRGWRLSVTLQQDNGQPKMSKVEFVP
ncbi:MAG: hypothetical protein U0R18_10860 [Mycobacterium sp.]